MYVDSPISIFLEGAVDFRVLSGRAVCVACRLLIEVMPFPFSCRCSLVSFWQAGIQSPSNLSAMNRF